VKAFLCYSVCGESQKADRAVNVDIILVKKKGDGKWNVPTAPVEVQPEPGMSSMKN
jgi:hypothetical protein